MTKIKTYLLLFLFSCSATIKSEAKIQNQINLKSILPQELNKIKQGSISESFIGKRMYINTVIGNDMNYTQEYILTEIDMTSKNGYFYGTTIQFNNNYTFTCSYSAQCWNDCFPSSTGRYKIVDNNHISIFVKDFKQSGMCDVKHIKLNTDLGIYKITKNKDKTLKLTKSK